MHLFPSGRMKVLMVVGARPNFMKVAPIIRAAHDHHEERTGLQIDHLLVHTGQHYDEAMSDRFFADLGLPTPDVHLGVGSGSHAQQTAEVMKKFEDIVLREKPDVVVVVGDVNSTLACALVTAKLSLDSAGSRPLIAHVEAGLRSFDRTMPEEINRIVTDHVSDLLFVTEESGLQNLLNEGISPDWIHFVGNTMIDSLLAFNEKAEASTVLEELGLRIRTEKDVKNNAVARYALLTLHRPSNVDTRDAFLGILEGLEELAAGYPIVFPVHPRTRRRIKEFGLESCIGVNKTSVNSDTLGSENMRKGIILTDPLGYLDFLCVMKNAAIVVTDSGGIQEETTCLGIPCVTVRENTERPVTVECGTNIIAGTGKDRIRDAIRGQMERKAGHRMPKHWDGRAAERIIDVLIRTHRDRSLARRSQVPEPCV
jgi:UDP-N-acetylglucosamine 2-epimerase (non-hydrolysing)